MPVKKSTKADTTSIKKKAPAKGEVKKEQPTPKKEINKKETAENPEIANAIIQNPNLAPIFDKDLYQEVFMTLRSDIDNLADKRGRSDKDYDAYDEAIYNLIANAPTEVSCQDFLAYCYKKGKYDFCVMNFEKYMKWSILAAANGNAFTLSKLQIFLTNAIDDILLMPNHEFLLDFLELSVENYTIFLSKLLCEQMVKLLDISAESLIKLPETFVEQDEKLSRMFDSIKMDAAKKVKEELAPTIQQLVDLVEQDKKALEKKEQERRERLNKLNNPIEEKEEKPTEIQSVEEKPAQTSDRFKKPPVTKKKFRY